MNHITFAAMERGSKLFGKATYVMDRGYDDNKMFQKMWELGQDFVICLTRKRKLLLHGKWVPAAELCAQRKGKIKLNLFYRGKEHEAYISHVKVQLTAAKHSIYLVLVYGITKHPVMLVINRAVSNKDDVVKIARLYFSRWRVEEYFPNEYLKYIFLGAPFIIISNGLVHLFRSIGFIKESTIGLALGIQSMSFLTLFLSYYWIGERLVLPLPHLLASSVPQSIIWSV